MNGKRPKKERRPSGWSSDSSSIPYADADSGDLDVRWDTSDSSSADEAAPPPRNCTSSASGGVDSCSLNNLLDALAEVEGGVSAAYSFSTLLDSDLDVPDAPPLAGGSRPKGRGHTLPRQRVRWDDGAADAVQLTPDELYYYCPSGPRKQQVASHNNNGSLLKSRQAGDRKKSATLDNAAHVDRSNYLSRQKDQIVSPVAPPLAMTRLQQRSPSPGSLDGVPPPPPQPHYISTLRANARRGNSPDKEKDPLAALQRFLRALYRELASRDQPQPPAWAPELPPGTLSPASFQPALRLVAPGESATMRMDQLLTALRMDEGILLEAPRRVLIEGLPGSGKTSLALRLLHSWATHSDPWLSNAISIALLIPLRELRASGQSLSQFIGKSLFPRAALGNGKDSFSRVWRRLGALEEKLMIVIDGDYDDELLPGEATDLLEGRLLPEARVVITLCPGRRANSLAPFVQRRVLLTGLQLNHVARLTQQYFLGKRIPDGASRFLDALGEESNPLRDLATWPLGWILLCIMFEEGSGTLPSPNAPIHEIYNEMFKCMVSRCLARRGQSPTEGNELPTHCKKLLAEFGKLALSGINNGCFVYLDTDIKIVCRGLEVADLGFLTRGLQFSRGTRKGETYHVIHPSFSEYLAAYYVSSIVHYSNILQREMEEIPGFLHPDTPSLIPRILMGLLGRKGFLVFEQLCPLDVSIKVLFTLLRACGPGDANVAAVCRLLRCTGVGNSGAQVVHTNTGELLGWGLVLSSPACPLQALELTVQTEGVNPDALDKFFCALAENESVKAVRISSLLGHELSANQVIRMSKYVALTVPKPRLQTFELVITCVDESPPDRFQPLVNSLSACLSQGEISCPRLSKLVLDLSLNSLQLVQLCAALEEAPSVSVLHLPHLGCGADGLRALASLMRVRPLLALNLSGSWGALVRDDPPSSSGASVGSSSGSTERPKGAAGSPKSSSYFSLPRSHTYHSLSRSTAATLPRAPGTPKDDKRLSDSALFQKYCPPVVCESLEHRTASGFHAIFESAKDPNVCVRALNVSKCALGADDALCLGDTVRKSRSLAALRLEGTSRLGEVLPVILALPESPALQLLDLASPRIVFMDAPTQLLCHALSRSPSLRLLGLDGWTFRVEEDVTLTALTSFLRSTDLRDIVLSHCRIHITCVEGRLARLGKRDDYEVRAELLSSLPEFNASSVAFLRLAGFAVAVNDHVVLRGPHILPFLRGFTRLSELDLSLDQPGARDDPDKEEFVDDKTLVHFFLTLSQNFRSLQSLRIGGWRVKLEEPERSLRSVGRSLRLCSLSHLRADGVIMVDGSKNSIEHCFLQTAVASLGLLTWLAIEGVTLQPHQAATFGRAVRDRFAGATLRISAQDVSVDSVKAMIDAVQEGAKAEVTYLGGAGCNLRIQRVVKNHKIRGRIRRFTSLKD
ncbi:uncharacterized protein LOC132198899 [Neocloeon triangulifer]|uniref:uncharacterized protein LOC132198899 n=1 Tax=Neocloeon triangulifer TaxID=2078957 RepID=UPI00286ED869|nr:uncharacterized protein LOC132198899 [Neocloeon triangulifer]